MCRLKKRKQGQQRRVRKKKILVGLHMSKDPDGIETTIQLAVERKAKKTYEVPKEKPTVVEEEE